MSLNDFFLLLQRSDLTPITLLDRPNTVSPRDRAIFAKIKENGEKLRSLSRALQVTLTSLNSSARSKAALLLQEISMIGELLQLGTWEMITVSDFSRIMAHPEWKTLFNLGATEFELTVDIKRTLRSTEEVFNELKVE